MKQLIVSVAIVVALIAFFVIVDHKVFYSGDDVALQKEAVARKPASVALLKPVEQSKETKPTAETKPVETKTVAGTKPTTVKPGETKPVAETKPVETKPVVEIKPSEAKHTEVKPTETKAVTETKPVAETKPVTETKEDETNSVEKKPAETVAETKSMPAPTAVPVVSAEEAVKLNEFAIFLADIKKTVVEGEIVERSELPDPQKSDYPNCRFSVHFTGNSIKSGEPCPRDIVLVVEGFSNYKILATNDIAAGDKIECSIIPFDALSEEYKSTQQADDLNLFLLDNYYVIDIKKINSFTDNAIMPKSGILFLDGCESYISIYEREINPPISPEFIKSKEKCIEAELRKMDELLNGYDETRIKEINTEFSTAWKREKEKDIEGYNRLGTYVWRNVDSSFWCLPINYNTLIPKFNKLTDETLDCFSALREACEANGVQLIVAMVPNNYVISSRIINEHFRNIPDIQMATYVKQLSEIGIEAVYTADSVVSNYNRFEFAYNYPLDYHPADTTQDVISELIAKRVERYEFGDVKLDPSRFSCMLYSCCSRLQLSFSENGPLSSSEEKEKSCRNG